MICTVSARRNGVRNAPGAGTAEKVPEAHMSVHVAVCYGPVQAWRMLLVNNYVVWHDSIDRHVETGGGGGMPGLSGGSYTTASGPITTFERCYFDLPQLFAEDEGPRGSVEFYQGLENQNASGRLGNFYTDIGTSGYSDFRGVASLFFDDFSWGKPVGTSKTDKQYYVAAQVTCHPKADQMDPTYMEIPAASGYTIVWTADRRTGSSFDANATVQSNPAPPNVNPAHVLWALLTESSVYGLGMPTSALDVASFNAAAQTLHSEGFGISFVMPPDRNVLDTISDIIELIQATLSYDEGLEKWKLTLMRADYDPDDAAIPTITPETAALVEFTRKTCDGLLSEVEVAWTDPASESLTTVTVRNQAVAEMGGKQITAKRSYYMVRDPYLAHRLALRDLKQMSWPQRMMTVTVDRSFWNIKPGDIVRVTWEELSLQNLMMRVVSADFGGPRTSGITLRLVEDVYALDVPDSIVQTDTPWTGVHTPPTPLDTLVLATAPYVVMAPDERDAGGVAMALAYDAAPDCVGFRMIREVTSGAGTDWQSEGRFSLTDNGTLASALTREAETVITVANLVASWNGRMGLAVGDWVIAGTGEDDQEIMVVQSYDPGTDEVTLLRGAYDTLPEEWAAGDRLWFINPYALFLSDSALPEGVHTIKALTTTGIGELDKASAAPVPLTITGRGQAPTRPANMTVEGTAWPADATSDGPNIDVTWANRNRIDEEDALKWSDPDVTSESQQETKIDILDTSMNVIHTQTEANGATSASIPKTVAAGHSEVWVRLTAIRDGKESIRHPMQKVVGL